MFVGDRYSWIRIVLKVRGSVLPRIWRRVLVATFVSVAVTLLSRELDFFHTSLTPTPFTLLGMPLGIYLGFRNNTAYDRFWEGRRLWGALVNTTRSLTRQTLTLVNPAADGDDAAVDAFRRDVVHTVIAYVHALRMHLRDEPPFGELAAHLPPASVAALEGERNVPIAILHGLGERLRGAWQRGWVHPYHVPVLEGSLTALTDIQGACERIKSTPIPFSYTVLIHRIVGLYCLLLPFGLVESVKWGTPVVSLFISYAFFGLDAVGDEIENPFGTDINDLPLGALSRTIEVNLRQRLGEKDLPPAVTPVDNVLL